MTDTKLLKAKLLLKDMTIESLAKAIGMSCAALSYKINNRRDFSISEVAKIRNVLGLNPEECDRIFFAGSVDNLTT